MNSKFSLVTALTLISSVATSNLSALEHEFDIKTGWNHINLPIAVSNQEPSHILDKFKYQTNVVWGKNNSNEWISYVPDTALNTLEKIEVSRAYFLKATSNIAPKIIGTKSVEKIKLTNGWNLFTIFHRDISISDFEAKVNDKLGNLNNLESAYIFDRDTNFWYFYTPSGFDANGNPTSFTGSELKPNSFIYMKFKNLTQDLELNFSFGVNEPNIGIINQDSNDTNVKLFVENIITPSLGNTNTPEELVDSNNLPNVIKLYSLDGGRLFDINIPGEYANSPHVEIEVEERARFDVNLTNVNAGDTVTVDNLTKGFFPEPTKTQEVILSKSTLEDITIKANDTATQEITIFNAGSSNLSFSIETSSVLTPSSSVSSSYVQSFNTKDTKSDFSVLSTDFDNFRITLPDFLDDTFKQEIVDVDNATYSDINDRRNAVNDLKNQVNQKISDLNGDLSGVTPNTTEWNEIQDKMSALNTLLSELDVLMNEPDGSITTIEDDPIFVTIFEDSTGDQDISDAPDIKKLEVARIGSSAMRFKIEISNFSSVDLNEQPFVVVAFNSSESNDDGQDLPADEKFKTDLYAYYDFNFEELYLVNLVENETEKIENFTKTSSGITFDLSQNLFERTRRVPVKVYSYNKFGEFKDITDVAPNSDFGYFDVNSIISSSSRYGYIPSKEYKTIEFEYQPYQAGTYDNIIQISTNDSSREVIQLKNSLTATIDDIAPSHIDDLTIESQTHNSVTLTWTAVGDNENSGNSAEKYELLISTSPDFNSTSLTTIELNQEPKNAGETETYTVENLDSNRSYYFGIIAYDLAGNKSSEITDFQNGTNSSTSLTTDIAPTFDLSFNSVSITDTGSNPSNETVVLTNNGGSDLIVKYKKINFETDNISSNALFFSSSIQEPELTATEKLNIAVSNLSEQNIKNNSFIVKYKDDYEEPDFSILSSKATKQETLKNGAKVYNAKEQTFENYINLMYQLANDPDVEYVEPNIIFKAQAVSSDITNSWWIDDSDTSVFDVNISDAWAKTTGSDEVTIAVIDTGIDINHSELSDSIWSNIDEIPNNGLDDDNNSYIDDINGFNFVGTTSNIADDNGHGTHCAGIITANNDNTGMVGIAPDTTIMPIKALDSTGDGDLASMISAIYYAIENGADIINMSLGTPSYSSTFEDAIQDAYQAGILIVSASGNENQNIDLVPMYPASFSNVISVGATTQSGELASFSNKGSSTVDISAPGKLILSTIPSSITQTNNSAPNGYDIFDGTSMATPMISATASLLKAYNSDYTAQEITDLIYNGATQLESLDGYINNKRFLNISKSLSLAVPNGNWAVYLSDEEFTLSPNESKTLEFSFHSVNLATGNYNATVYFETNIDDEDKIFDINLTKSSI
jgi:subtilisin family serine protease